MSHLKLLKFSNDDYLISEVLNKENSFVLDNELDIQKVFSLLFQWPDRSRVKIKDPASGGFVDAEVSYDDELSEIEEIYIDTKRIDPNQAKEYVVRFEIFRTCYEFQTKMNDFDVEDENTYLNLEIPFKLTVFKRRKLPRYKPEKKNNINLNFNEKYYENCELNDISANGLSLKVDKLTCDFESDNAIITINAQEYKCNLKYVEDSGNIVAILKFENREKLRSYLNFYTDLVYSHLSPRSTHDFDDVLSLYDSSNLINRFSSEGIENIKDEFAKTFELLKDDTEVNSFDFVATKDDLLVGASSASLVGRTSDNKKEYWSWHSYCCQKDINNLDMTFELYRWRAECFSMFPNSTNIMGWYNSSGKWVDKVWTKFKLKYNRDFNIESIEIFKLSELPDSYFDKNESLKTSKNNLGRTFVESKNYYGGYGPGRLAISNSLNFVCYKKNNQNGKIPLKLKKIDEDLYVTLPVGKVKREKSLDLNKYLLFNNDCMADFISSLDHTIAVLKRKNRLYDSA